MRYEKGNPITNSQVFITLSNYNMTSKLKISILSRQSDINNSCIVFAWFASFVQLQASCEMKEPITITRRGKCKDSGVIASDVIFPTPISTDEDPCLSHTCVSGATCHVSASSHSFNELGAKRRQILSQFKWNIVPYKSYCIAIQYIECDIFSGAVGDKFLIYFLMIKIEK